VNAPRPGFGTGVFPRRLPAAGTNAPIKLITIMSLIQSARMNGHDPYAYLKDVLTRLPMQRANAITDLLPHRWMPI
jgi:hypothetical protein